MKSLIFSLIVFFTFVTTGNAQSSKMEQLINQSMSKLQTPSPEALMTCVSELRRIEAMFPDSVAPKQLMAQQSLFFALSAPTAKGAETLIAESLNTINKLESMPGMDKSDLHTLRGMYYMALIVQNPAQNGPRYYISVMEHYEKALKLNPDNKLAQQMQAKFMEGMKQMGRG